MKRFLPILFATIFFLSCNKNIEHNNSKPSYVANIQATLKDSLTGSDYSNLDLSRAVETKKDNASRFFRIPFTATKFPEKFILLYTDTAGKILNGLIIQLRQLEANNISKYSYNGTIEIRYLNGAIKLISEVKNGYIGALNTDPIARPLVVPQAKEEYPEIIVDWYYGGTPYINSSAFFGFNSGSRSVNYSSVAANEDNEGDQGSRSNNQNNNDDDEELVDFEFIDNLTPIDVSKYLKCFSNIPDYGATCSIAILVDIPVDDNPNSIFDFKQGATGHTFLQITKTNGGQTVTQNIGFYPVTTWKMLFTEPVKGKFVDNSEHEFNASFKMDITPLQLNNTLNHIIQLSTVNYDIDDYNCTDYALDIFNYSRIGNPLQIKKNQIPGGRSINGSSTPGALYNTLNVMKLSGNESNNIKIVGGKDFAIDSNGPCN
ncbi:hypothetical protein [Segetibacter koreensis]|uniref:hypothetical protein n=1 Tax=Segetibacter koreensis TaxID=398037 RepID=UPI00036B51C3|nr:hypothetical protein [Segetibacter koreensis]